MMNIELHPNFLKDIKKAKLPTNIASIIEKDIKMVANNKKTGKLLIGAMFPLKELKCLKWGIRVIFLIDKEGLYILSINRKKDDFSKAYKDALKRIKR